jgi:hypothetical protein
MAKGVYVGVGGVARKIKKVYVGVGGLSRKVKKIYVGANGVARLVWSGSVPAGQVIFTSSQVWRVPDGVSEVEVFLVGGGGKTNSVGGGGGFTAHYPVAGVVPNTEYAVVIGAGGYTGNMNAADGSGSSFGGLSVAGGKGVYTNASNPSGKGGSGGGANYPTSSIPRGGNGGSDGANGGGAMYANGTIYTTSGVPTGQGFTTRAFKEAGGSLYAGGGGGFGQYYDYSSSGGSSSYKAGGGAGGAGGGGAGGFLDPDNYARRPVDGTPNTGGGAGGFQFNNSQNTTSYDVRGGSGIVIVRWKEQ